MTELVFSKVDVVDEDFRNDTYNYRVEYNKTDRMDIFYDTIGSHPGILSYKAIINGNSVGFIQLKRYNGGCFGLENIYVKPEYRKLGYAKLMYEEAIDEFGLELMSIAYHRVKKPSQIKYWNDVGFTHIALIPGQMGSDKGLCHLLTDYGQTEALGSFELTFAGVKKCMGHSQRITKKIAKKYGCYVTRDDLKVAQEFIYTVLKHHFRIAA